LRKSQNRLISVTDGAICHAALAKVQIIIQEWLGAPKNWAASYRHPRDTLCMREIGEEKTHTRQAGQFNIRRFKLINGQETRIYCKLVKIRLEPELNARYRLFEDHQGQQWMEIDVNDQAYVMVLQDKSFEQQVVSELLTLGINKYSG
jgi:hypothetical protein